MFGWINEACGFKRENVIKLCIIAGAIGLISLFAMYFILSQGDSEMQEFYNTAYETEYDKTIGLEYKDKYDEGYEIGYDAGYAQRDIEELIDVEDGQGNDGTGSERGDEPTGAPKGTIRGLTE